jgi:hypothetical protein
MKKAITIKVLIELEPKNLYLNGEYYRELIAKALGDCEHLHPKILFRLLKDESPGVRAAAAKSFGHHGDTIAVPQLIKLLKDKNSNVRLRVTEALGKIGSKKAIGPLLELLNSGKYEVIEECAMEAIGQIVKAWIKDILFLMIDSEFEKDAEDVKRVLKQIQDCKLD